MHGFKTPQYNVHDFGVIDLQVLKKTFHFFDVFFGLEGCGGGIEPETRTSYHIKPLRILRFVS